MQGLLKPVLLRARRKLSRIKTEDLSREFGEFSNFVRTQLFNQIPGLSAIGALLAGAWVSSTFTTSHFRGVLASWGLIKGGTKVVGPMTYKFLSVLLPVMAAAFTAYAVQKAMRAWRERQLRVNMSLVPVLGEDVRKDIEKKMDILTKAKEAGLISKGEFEAKRASLYDSHVRSAPSKLEELLIRKISG